ncbi:MAG: oligopeptide ABC transporter ATP-binding protein [Thermotoga sp.]|nr:MAG: oligopeptide ABC transporter ATP-binding protein [Thermotoga sp.]
MSLVKVEKLRKYFPLSKFRRGRFVKAVDGVDLNVEKGEILGILGESGCGKSTLGLVMSRLELETSGRILFDGKDLSGTLRLNTETRRRIQIIFQNPYDSFDPRLSVKTSLLTPLKIHKIGKNDEERLKIVAEYMEKAGLIPYDDFLRRYPHELSGGQLQRISVLRAMMLKPDFLVADECVSMLDVSVRAEVINLLLDLVESNSTATMFITHDISLGKYVSNRMAVMYLGKIVEIGKTEDIMNNPLHPYTRILMSYSPSLFKRIERIPVEGEVGSVVGERKGCYFAGRCPFSTKACFEIQPSLVEVEDGHHVACLEVEKQL